MTVHAQACFEPRLDDYDIFVVAFSAGKDSLACVLHLLELGVPPQRIELHHHDIDGRGAPFMDWPITPAYSRAVARHLGLPIYFSWREGGFRREMERQDAATAPVLFERPAPYTALGGAGGAGPPGTRQRFPQVSSDLRVRYCSAALKIDVLAAVLRNEPRFDGVRTLVITGERAEESPSRARYATFEPHRANARSRHVDHWRPIHAWTAANVWDCLQRHSIRPHPAYGLGWGRLSCMCCIFGSPNQWATLRAIFPDRFALIAAAEAASGFSIHRTATVTQLAERGQPYAAALQNPELVALAQSTTWRGPVTQRPWRLPAGAYAEAAGPS